MIFNWEMTICKNCCLLKKCWILAWKKYLIYLILLVPMQYTQLRMIILYTKKKSIFFLIPTIVPFNTSTKVFVDTKGSQFPITIINFIPKYKNLSINLLLIKINKVKTMKKNLIFYQINNRILMNKDTNKRPSTMSTMTWVAQSTIKKNKNQLFFNKLKSQVVCTNPKTKTIIVIVMHPWLKNPALPFHLKILSILPKNLNQRKKQRNKMNFQCSSMIWKAIRVHLQRNNLLTWAVQTLALDEILASRSFLIFLWKRRQRKSKIKINQYLTLISKNCLRWIVHLNSIITPSLKKLKRILQ